TVGFGGRSVVFLAFSLQFNAPSHPAFSAVPTPPSKPSRQHFPRRPPRHSQFLDQIHPIRHQTQPRRLLRLPRNQSETPNGSTRLSVFDTDTGLKDVKDQAQKEFPLNELLMLMERSKEVAHRLFLTGCFLPLSWSTVQYDVDQTVCPLVVGRSGSIFRDEWKYFILAAAECDRDKVHLIFGHINKKMRRALPLVEAISKDFNDQLLRILTSHQLPYTPYETFERLLAQTTNIFWTWDNLIKEFTIVAREVTRKRSERFVPIKVVPAHAKLQEQTHYLLDWQKQHEQLAVMTGPTKGLAVGGLEAGGMDMEEEVKEAYEIVKRIDVLDVSVEGTEIWVAAENAYNKQVSRVENQIIARLRDRLGTARNANEDVWADVGSCGGDMGRGIEWLVAEYRNEAQRMIGKAGCTGTNIKWDHFVSFVREFASVISVLQDKTNSVIDLYKDILRAVEELATCSYTTGAFAELLGRMQSAVWCSELDRLTDKDGRREMLFRDITNKRRGDLTKRKEKFMESNMIVKPIAHEIRIQNQVIFLDPPIEHARATWIRQLHDWIGVIRRLQRIQSSWYEIELQMQGVTDAETTYSSLLQFQSLWDLKAEYVFNRLSDSLSHWQQLLTRIKKTRLMFDTSEVQKSFGAVTVDYEQVQARVNAKNDTWQRDIWGQVDEGDAYEYIEGAE
ncbi:dynein heavy chain, partial [Marasmius crinis-equi]